MVSCKDFIEYGKSIGEIIKVKKLFRQQEYQKRFGCGADVLVKFENLSNC